MLTMSALKTSEAAKVGDASWQMNETIRYCNREDKNCPNSVDYLIIPVGKSLKNTGLKKKTVET